MWCNPPYGKNINKWIDKAIEEHTEGNFTTCDMLLPFRPDTQWFYSLFAHAETSTRRMYIGLIKGRLKFTLNNKESSSAPFPSVLVALTNEKSEKHETKVDWYYLNNEGKAIS